MSKIEDSGSSPMADASAAVGSGARRRALLRGLLSGTAVAGAGMPMRAQATFAKNYCDKQPGGGKGRPADASGFNSIVSLAPDNNNECSGYVASCYGTTGSCYSSSPSPHWTFTCGTKEYVSGSQTGAVVTCESKFRKVFNATNTTINNKSLAALCSPAEPASLQKTYATAYANACRAEGASPGFRFPYSPAEVVALYQGSKQASGQQLFDQYLSSKT